MEQAIRGDTKWEDITFDDKEREIKETLKREARINVGLRKFKGKTKFKGWWDKEVGKVIEDRKRESRRQRHLAKMVKPYGKMYGKELIEAWKRYSDAKETAQVIIRKKIRRWDEEQAQALNNMPCKEREKKD